MLFPGLHRQKGLRVPRLPVGFQLGTPSRGQLLPQPDRSRTFTLAGTKGTQALRVTQERGEPQTLPKTAVGSQKTSSKK